MALKLPNPFRINADSTQIVTRDTTKYITQFTENLRYNTITPLPFEKFPEDIFTLPLIREHHDSYLFYIATHSLDQEDYNRPFSIYFQTSNETLVKNIYPNNIFMPIADVFSHFFTQLEEYNSICSQPIILPSANQALKKLKSYFEVPDIEIRRNVDNPHHWLETDLLQLKHFQYNFLYNISLDEQTRTSN